MVTTVQHSNTVAFPAEKKPGSNRRPNSPRQYSELRLQLSNALQTTLELSQILQLFFETAQQQLAIDGLIYRNDKLITNIELGNAARNNCHYQLVTNQDRLGELSFSRGKRFADKELYLLEVLISCLICPVRNALMYREAVQSALRDSLTGAGNRLALENTLDREIALAARHKLPLSVLAIDIDHFKKINDNFGHSAGDCVLKDVVRLMGQDCRGTDSAYRAYRYGGEEFVLILNNTQTEGSMIVAERIRQHIADMTTTFEDHAIKVTVSIGVASILEGDTIASLFARADKALYQAKNNGRNQVVDSRQLVEKPQPLIKS